MSRKKLSSITGPFKRVAVKEDQRNKHDNEGWRYIAPEPVPPKVHAAFNSRYMRAMLTRGKVMRALIELYAEGKLDEMVEKKVEQIA